MSENKKDKKNTSPNMGPGHGKSKKTEKPKDTGYASKRLLIVLTACR